MPLPYDAVIIVPMNKSIILIYLCLCWAPVTAWAQVVEDEPSADNEQWQLTFDVIKQRSQQLLEQNNALTAQYASLNSQAQTLVQSVNEQQAKNTKAEQFLKARGGRTDQQAKIEELNSRIKAQKSEIAAHEQEWAKLKKTAADSNRKANLKRLKIAEAELHDNAQALQDQAAQKIALPPLAPADDELTLLRKQLEQEKANEVTLEQQIKGSKQHKEDTGDLKARLEVLRRQKLDLEKQILTGPSQQSNKDRYYEMSHKKAELESRIWDFEGRINSLKNPAIFGLSWATQKKKIIHDIVQSDARNTQLREKINTLREDIALLRDQVGKLERRVNFNQGAGKTR